MYWSIPDGEKKFELHPPETASDADKSFIHDAFGTGAAIHDSNSSESF